jgi:hypothetical protein
VDAECSQRYAKVTNLFGELFLLTRKKASKKTEASFPVTRSSSPQERLADLGHTATLRGSDLFQMTLKI